MHFPPLNNSLAIGAGGLFKGFYRIEKKGYICAKWQKVLNFYAAFTGTN